MKTPRKTKTLNIRMRRDQRRKLLHAAVIESGRRTHAVSAGALLLELGMKGVERILAEAQQATPKAA